MKGSHEGCAPCPPCEKKKKKRPAPAHSELQVKVIKKIGEKHDINYREAIGKLKETVSKAIGDSWDDVKAKGSMTWIEALEKTMDYLKNN